MMELTKERLQEIAEDGFLKHGEAKSMARQLLAGLEQEPVAWRWRQNESKPWHLTVHSDCAGEVQPLYASPQLPQTAVPDEIDGNRLACVYLEETTTDKVDAYVKGWNACRAAMLQGGKS